MASSNHEADKENVYRTRIPLPKNPLPELPKHLLVKSKKPKNIQQRCPLKILNSQTMPEAGPSKLGPHNPEHLLNIDMKYVTTRRGNRSNDSDWHNTVFNDERVDESACVVTIRGDEINLDDNERQRYFVEERKKNILSEAVSVSPIWKSPLEQNRVRKLKRSLKRPHSLELQGVSSTAQVKLDKLENKVQRRLWFNENLQERLQFPDFWKRSYMRSLNRDYATDVFNYLLAEECKPLGMPRTSSITRACVINWLMKVNGPDGNPAVIQSTCWYLDSILGTKHVELDNLQLVATACFWIAQKLNGPYMCAMKLVKCASKAFTSGQLVTAEKAVLTKLKFPKQPIVAQEYINYLSWWIDIYNAGEIEVAASFIAMCGLMVDQVLCNEYPSVIAVAAVESALLLLGKTELMPRLHLSHIFEAAEKKTTDLSYTCSILHQAVRTVSASCYEYKAPVEHYSIPPCNIAQRVIAATNELSVIDTRNMTSVKVTCKTE